MIGVTTQTDWSCREPAESGIALVLVLWILVLLSSIAASLVYSTRTELLVSGNQESTAIAESLAEAAVARAIYDLSQPTNSDPEQWKADASTRAWQYGGAEILVTIADESGKVDINSASATLLTNLFAAAGANDPEALADAVLDWRDSDDFRSPRGAERADYLDAGKNYGPANAPFEIIEDLRQVLGMTEDIYHRIESGITIYSYQPGINTTQSPRAALLALPGVSAEQIDAYLDERQSQLLQGQPAMPFAYATAQAVPSASLVAAYDIQVRVVLRDNTQFVRDTVVRRSNTTVDPIAILAWRSPTVD